MLLRSFPKNDDGSYDWSVFESGPPDYLVEFMEVLEELARKTWPRLVQAQQALGVPSWRKVPSCPPDPDRKGRYLYDPAAWSRSASSTLLASPKNRISGKRPAPAPVRVQAADRARHVRPPPPPPPARVYALPQVGWYCSLLHKRIGVPRARPAWFNDPTAGPIDVATGVQLGLTCGAFAVNHCFLRHGKPAIAHASFQANAGDGVYPGGDFDDGALRLNLAARNCGFDRLEGHM